ncbi:MAG TPA: arginine--tRNA ligase [Solirubrobacteraceae bacterium]|nr:arginine--tRNA ligase [Solirubrobacteraceae bacterium]
MGPVEHLHEAVRECAALLVGGDGTLAAAVKLERPPRPELGDYSTNAALLLAPRLESSPREVAVRLGAALEARLGDALDRTDVAGPGFLNLFVSDQWLTDALHGVIAAGERFGAVGTGAGEPINLEFVSANPTGPVHIGHARGAAYGDALARLLSFRGYEVTREFYVNDYGSQVLKLGESVRALALGEPVPEDGYHGDYVATLVPPERARTLDIDELSREALAACLAQIRVSLERFGVNFDVWFSERSLHASGAVEAALARLAELGETFTQEGALWLRTTARGDDRDRVLIRSDGQPTYFCSDIAYLDNKRSRGFDRLVYVWGSDHHGYEPRMKAAWESLGGNREAVELIAFQFVHLVGGGGARTAMSKREGEYVTLDELVDRVGVDAARWFLLARSHDTTVELDVELATRQSADNPVYYVQYAHARIASMLAKLEQARVEGALEAPVAVEPLHPSERTLLKRLLAFPADLAEAVERRAAHRVTASALEIAQEFTAFYRDCRVVGAEPYETESLRIAIARAAQQTIATALSLLGVSAPETM